MLQYDDAIKAQKPKLYGTNADSAPQKNGNGKRKSNLIALIAALVVPFFIFTAVFALRSSKISYDGPSIAIALCVVLLLAIGGFAFLTVSAVGNPAQGDPRILAFLTFMSLIGWIVAYFAGDMNFQHNLKPFYDISQLNHYPSVNPSLYTGVQFMDAGQIDFTEGSHLDLTKSAGFMNKDVYCVAPIVGGQQTAGANLTFSSSYDFWAVGLNCCSGHVADFHCGEYNSPKANKGLRLLRDDQREYFRLAVQMASASFNIKATHPIFVTWMAEPSLEVNSYQDDGARNFIIAIVLFFCCHLVLTVVTGIALSKV